MSWPVPCTGAAAPMIPSVVVVTNQISSQTAEMNAPADIASLSTKAIVLPGNFFRSFIISIVTSMAPPGGLMSSRQVESGRGLEQVPAAEWTGDPLHAVLEIYELPLHPAQAARLEQRV